MLRGYPLQALTEAWGAAPALGVTAVMFGLLHIGNPGIGVLEGAQVWIFGMLGYPTEVGLAVGLAVRLRELLWMAPGVVFLMVSGLRTSIGLIGKD